MFDGLTADSIYADMMMLRPQDTRAFLVVEGVEDVRTLDAHISEEACQLFIAGGRENALGVIEIVVQESMENVGALVDADHVKRSFDVRVELYGVTSTDLNDLDSEVLHVPHLPDRICASHVDGRGFREKLTRRGFATAIEAIENVACPVTALRYNCERYGIGLSTKDFPIVALYARGEVSLDINKSKRAAIARLPVSAKGESTSLVEEWIESQLMGTEFVSPGSWRPYHNGHHLFSALHALLKSEGGYIPKIDNIENSVRGAVSWPELWSIACIRRLSAYFEALGFWIWRHPKPT